MAGPAKIPAALPGEPPLHIWRDQAIAWTLEGRSDIDIENQLAENLRQTGQSDEDQIRLKVRAVHGLLQADPRWVNRRNANQPSRHVEAGPSQTPAATPREGPAPITQTIQEQLTALTQLVHAMALQQQAQVSRQTAPSMLAAREPQAPRMRIPDPEPFSGVKDSYSKFKMAMKIKMHADMSFGNGISETGYIFLRLKGRAADMMLSWMRRNPEGTATDMWAQMDATFEDTLGSEKARRDLQNLRQSKLSLQEFNQKFMQLAFDAGEEENVPNLKTRYLAALRDDLATLMIAVDVPEHWGMTELMERVGKIDVNLDRFKLGKGGFQRPNNRPSAQPTDEMDWIPTSPVKSNSARPSDKNQGKRAKWATAEERKERIENNTCLRCGKSGHFARKCRLLPAERPVKAAAATVEEVGTSDEEEEESSGSEN